MISNHAIANLDESSPKRVKGLMKKLTKLSFFALLLIGCASTPATDARKVIETPDFETITAKANSLLDQYGKQKVLLVSDLDNVLLAMNEELGSEQWFDWQSEMIRKKDPTRVVETFELLVEFNTPLLNQQKMHVIDHQIPVQIGTFQSRGGDAVVLTARAPTTQPGTLRNLKSNGYQFAQSAINKTWNKSRKFIPEKTQTKREIEFVDGVIFTRGQDKGKSLEAFLKHADKKYEAIVFVDNKLVNIEQVLDAFAQEKISLNVYRYSHEDSAIEAFKFKDKTAVMKAWTQFKSKLR